MSKRIAVVTGGTVSYTHLDVYKRQVPSIAEFVQDAATMSLSLIHI